MTRISMRMVAGVLAAAVSAVAQQATNPLQARLDAALPGDVLSVPAGIYPGSLVLRDDVALVGEGADVTIIDGQGTDCVVSGARNAVLLGFTVRNGRVGVNNLEVCMGLFECRIADCQAVGVQVIHGCAVLANNLIEGHGQGSGVFCLESNPYLVNNLVVSNGVGVRLLHQSYPSLVQNTFVANGTAVLVETNCEAYLSGNTFDGNGQLVVGQALGDTDKSGAVALDGKVPHRGAGLAEYRTLMASVLRTKLNQHPVVVYDLRGELGRFGMATLFPWATFAVGASTADTVIERHTAYDRVNDADLHSERVPQGLPAVAVINPAVKDVSLERYVLDCEYVHGPSYAATADGGRVFTRLTNLTRVEIILPQGFVPAAVNFPWSLDEANGLRVVKIVEVGRKRIELTLLPE